MGRRLLQELATRDGAGVVDGVAVPEVDVDAVETMLGDEVPLIDVRERSEFVQARLPGARLVPMAEVPGRLAELPSDARVLVVCAVGARSAQVTAFLRQQGIDAVNVAGGTRAWVLSGRPYDSG